MELTFFEKLSEIQNTLKAPKSQFNKFGNYKYRNCEDILEALKPLLHSFKLALTLNDEIVMIGARFYVKAIAKITDGTNTEISTAFAREAETQKGMSDAQLTGSASSYARKYALNGLFCIDDTKDDDSNDDDKKENGNKTNGNNNYVNNTEKKVNKVTENNKCEKCGSDLVKKTWTNPRTQEVIPYLGCSKHPECKFTKKL